MSVNQKATQLPKSTHKRVLILDDDAMSGQTIQKIAEFAGFDATYTTSHQQFFQQVKTRPPDILILDLLMPDMDGVEVMIRLGELGCKAGVIISSGVGKRILDAAERSAREHGLNVLGTLSKPFSPTELRQLLNTRIRDETSSAGPDNHLDREPEEAHLAAAIKANDIFVVYQPKIHCRTGTLAGFEALARWNWEGEQVSPDFFIPLAERSGLIDPLTEQIFDTALRWMASITQNGSATGSVQSSYILNHVFMSLNISARSLTNEALFERLLKRCRELGVDRERLIFELTETSAMEDAVKSLDTLTRLRMQGFHLSIDDFGTGYSSMVQLARLPFSEIKVDKSFVINAASSQESRSVIRSIVDLGRNLGLSSTAEGIEDEGTLKYLQQLNCTFGQGFFISPPLPPDRLLAWHQHREREREQQRLIAGTVAGLPGPERWESLHWITSLARKLLDTPVGLVTFIDADTQWIKSGTGLVASNQPRSESFCTRTIEFDGALVIEDTRLDYDFRQLDLVTGAEAIRSYAGYPLCLPGGEKAGALCVLDRKPRTFDATDVSVLSKLAHMAERELTRGKSMTPDLLSRGSLRAHADAIIDLAVGLNKTVGLILLTLDQLGSINRIQGWEEGNQVLQEASGLVQSLVHETDIVGRYRGSEFVVLRIDADPAGMNDMQQRLHDALEARHASQNKHVDLMLSWAFLETGLENAFESALEQARARALPSSPGFPDDQSI